MAGVDWYEAADGSVTKRITPACKVFFYAWINENFDRLPGTVTKVLPPASAQSDIAHELRVAMENWRCLGEPRDRKPNVRLLGFFKKAGNAADLMVDADLEPADLYDQLCVSLGLGYLPIARDVLQAMLSGGSGVANRGALYTKQYRSAVEGLLGSTGANGLLPCVDIWANCYLDRLATLLSHQVPGRASQTLLSARERQFLKMRWELRSADLNRFKQSSLSNPALSQYTRCQISNTTLPPNYQGVVKTLGAYVRARVPTQTYAGINTAAAVFMSELESRLFAVFCGGVSKGGGSVSTVSGDDFEFPPDSPIAGVLGYIAGWCIHKSKKLLLSRGWKKLSMDTYNMVNGWQMFNTVTSARTNNAGLAADAEAARGVGLPARVVDAVLQRVQTKGYGTFPSTPVYRFVMLFERNAEHNLTSANFLLHKGCLLGTLKNVLIADARLRAEFMKTIPEHSTIAGNEILLDLLYPRLITWLVNMRGGDTVRSLVAQRSAVDRAAGANSTRSSVAASSSRKAKRRRPASPARGVSAVLAEGDPDDEDGGLGDQLFVYLCDAVDDSPDGDGAQPIEDEVVVA